MKKRVSYALITVVVMILGLASRKYMFIFPDLIAPFIGDACWAMMVYFGFRFSFPNLSLVKGLIIAISFSFLIEFTQLYQADWINTIRATTLGHLILGQGFLVADLISYTIGILIGVGIDHFQINWTDSMQ